MAMKTEKTEDRPIGRLASGAGVLDYDYVGSKYGLGEDSVRRLKRIYRNNDADPAKRNGAMVADEHISEAVESGFKRIDGLIYQAYRKKRDISSMGLELQIRSPDDSADDHWIRPGIVYSVESRGLPKGGVSYDIANEFNAGYRDAPGMFGEDCISERTTLDRSVLMKGKTAW